MQDDLAQLQFFFNFIECFTIDAKCCRRSGLEPLYANFYTTGITETIVISTDAVNGLVDFANQLALAIASAQFKAKFFFLGSAIGRIRKVGRFVLHVADRAVDLFHQLAFPVE